MKALVINCSPVRTGATAEIVNVICSELGARYDTKSICIDDYVFAFCKGCRSCHNTAKCVMPDADVIREIMNEFDLADIIVSVAPSYWADIPGQFQSIHRPSYPLVQYPRASRLPRAREERLCRCFENRP